MKKLINGIVRFRREMMPSYRESFARLALEQKPDALFVACSDSRVVPNLFASADPGDLFVLRHMGNFIPAPDTDCGIAAGIEFAVENLKVQDIIICGHSNCGAMMSLLGAQAQTETLKGWLEQAKPAFSILKSKPDLASGLPEADRLSQANALLQVSNLERYPCVQQAVKDRQLKLHTWWFDLKSADVYSYAKDKERFEMIDEAYENKIHTGVKA